MTRRYLYAALVLISTIALIRCTPSAGNKGDEVLEVTTEKNALQHYLLNDDSTYSWKQVGTYDINSTIAYDLILTSQIWHDHLWKHQLTIIVPKEVKYHDALLFITGGSLKKGEPNMSDANDATAQFMASIAQVNKALVIIVRQTPMQPIFNGRVEDELISLTLHKFKNDGDFTWPLLFPMVKSAVRAMDAATAFASQELNHTVDGFVLSGASKRGWTTWLTGANDPRVKAIAPMVIDVLNMPVSLDYHIAAWGDYSPEIQDYIDLEIPQQIRGGSGVGSDLVTMVDPYSYRKELTMPKMIFIGTNDPYWPVDAIKNYLDSIPGENYIHYVPNAGHGLDAENNDQAIRALSSFFGHTLAGNGYPKLDWSISEDHGKYHVVVNATEDNLIDASYWSASSPDRDFRDNEWESKLLDASNNDVITWEQAYPESGYRAFYIDLKYLDINGNEYTKSTRMFVSDSSGIL